MKTKEEFNALKEEVENVSEKLKELTEEELAQVTGGRSGHHDDLDARPTWAEFLITVN